MQQRVAVVGQGDLLCAARMRKFYDIGTYEATTKKNNGEAAEPSDETRRAPTARQ